jgi:hypothetical protein
MSERAFMRSANVLSRSVDGEILLAAVDREDVDRLSPSAGAVWALLDKPRTVSALVDDLSAVFDVTQGRIARDVETLLSDLVSRGWVEVVAGG